MITSDLSSRAASAARILPTPSSIDISVGFFSPNARGNRVSSIMSAGDAGGFQFLHRAHHVQRVAVSMIGIDHQRQLAGAVDAIGLRGEFGQRQQDQVGIAQHGEGTDRTGEHADLEAEFLGDARRDRVEHRPGWMHSLPAITAR